MSIRLDLQMDGLSPEELRALSETLADPAELHAQIAGDAEAFMKAVGPGIAAGNHRTAQRLGANPTGHLAAAYQAIESESDATGAALLIPRASRLRAAFGPYTLQPKSSKYLTIPTHRESYGRRARELDDLFVIARPGKGLVLARRDDDGPDANSRFLLRANPGKRRSARGRDAGIEVMYLLVTDAEIPEDPNLIPFEELANEAQRSAAEYIDTAIEASLPS